MKVNELMVGDWASVSGKSVKITKDDLATMLIFLDDDSKIEPIPLTEEILVKISDFTVRGEYVISGANRYPYARIAWSRDKEKFYFSTLGSNCYLDYVHQLQHLLRLCGIDKEISI